LAERQAPEQAADRFIGVRYNTAGIEAVLPFVFGALAKDSWLIKHIDSVRNVAMEADTYLSGVSVFSELQHHQRAALSSAVQQQAARVLQATRNAIALLDRRDP
jgi:hypothetical protein